MNDEEGVWVDIFAEEQDLKNKAGAFDEAKDSIQALIEFYYGGHDKLLKKEIDFLAGLFECKGPADVVCRSKENECSDDGEVWFNYGLMLSKEGVKK